MKNTVHQNNFDRSYSQLKTCVSSKQELLNKALKYAIVEFNSRKKGNSLANFSKIVNLNLYDTAGNMNKLIKHIETLDVQEYGIYFDPKLKRFRNQKNGLKKFFLKEDKEFTIKAKKQVLKSSKKLDKTEETPNDSTSGESNKGESNEDSSVQNPVDSLIEKIQSLDLENQQLTALKEAINNILIERSKIALVA